MAQDQVVDAIEDRIAAETAGDPEAADLLPTLSANLRRLRVRRGHSLERLSGLSGVSRAMLSQIELGYSAPTINVVWRIANALDVPFSALLTQDGSHQARVLRHDQAKVLSSADGAFRSRALFPTDVPRRTEFYELRLAAGASEHAEAHAPGTTENLIVVHGKLRITAADQDPLDLDPGDAALFTADEPHVYTNTGTEDALIYLVMSYALVVG